MIEKNEWFTIAENFVKNTSCHLFITGKAGTGKTTFLKNIRDNTNKKSVVLAPTGVAAINAGGVTLHSFFQLPFGPFLPDNKGMTLHHTNANDIYSIISNSKINKQRRALFNEIELMIIDEASMLRADTFDAIDTILRHYRHQPNEPFGGVQVVLIGDLFQLPPVIKDDELTLLSQYYSSPFFFGSKVAEKANFLKIELRKIYRQSDQAFINILNNIRNKTFSGHDLDVLNSKLNTSFNPIGEEEKYIILCTHNYRANQINQDALNDLDGKMYAYQGEIKGDFNEYNLPVEKALQLKVGAQVMFIKNDVGEERRYYNGKLGTVLKLTENAITVLLADSDTEIVLEKEVWRNIRYVLNETDNSIDEEEMGSYSQFPIRLAWAVTIHKSQGLTFDHAVIDAGQSFAPGQVYVALSRCTSLNGIVLYSKILPHSISTDNNVVQYMSMEQEAAAIQNTYENEKAIFESKQLVTAFNLKKIIEQVRVWIENIPKRKVEKKADYLMLAKNIHHALLKHQQIAITFEAQIKKLLTHYNETSEFDLLAERINKGMSYFFEVLNNDLIKPLSEHVSKDLASEKNVKKYLEDIGNIQLAANSYCLLVYHLTYDNRTFNEGVALPKILESKAETDKRKGKGGTQQESLDLFKNKHSIEEIAAMRSLTVSTIQNHLAGFIPTGMISINDLISQQVYHKIEAVIKENPNDLSLGNLKGKLPSEISYGEIRIALTHYQWANTEGKK